MQPDNRKRRIELALEMLNELKSTYAKLDELSKQVDKHSDSLFSNFAEGSESSFQSYIDKYNSNTEKVKRLNYDITLKINSIFGYAKNESEMKKLVYPIRLYLLKKDLKKVIKAAGEQVSGITIENRFIREQLSLLQEELKHKALQSVRQQETYGQYQQLVRRKDELIAELRYLLPTIPGVCPAELDPDGFNQLYSKLVGVPPS